MSVCLCVCVCDSSSPQHEKIVGFVNLFLEFAYKLLSFMMEFYAIYQYIIIYEYKMYYYNI